MRSLRVYTALTFVLVVVVIVAPENALAFRSAFCRRSFRTTTPLRSVEVLSEVAVQAEILTDNGWGATLAAQLDTFWQTSPYTAAALVCGFKASMADFVAQQQQQHSSSAHDSREQEESSVATTTNSRAFSLAAAKRIPDNHKDDDDSAATTTALDMKRNFAFVVYGALYQGITHEYVFNHCYPVWFGTGCEVQVVAAKVAFNLLIQTTLVTLPVAYLCKAFICVPSDDSDKNNEEDTTTTDDESHNPAYTAMSKYWQDIQHQGLLWKCFALWGPVQCLTFSVVPEHLRVTFMAAVSFFWLILLSSISSNEATTVNETTTTTSQSERTLTAAPVSR